MAHTFVQASFPRRIVRKLSLILVARLRIGRWLALLPGFRSLYTRLTFARRDHTGLHSGVYSTFDEALAAIPRDRLSGWDNEDSAALWVDQIDPVRLSTYPVFFWVSKVLGENGRLVDYGGSIGLTYYGYRRYSTLPAGAIWTVIEVPSIAEQGRRVALREQAAGLRFGDDIRQAPACDVLLSAGALQYLPRAIPGLLEDLAAKPRYVLLNKLPVAENGDCWTLQNMGPAIAPMRIFDRAGLLRYFSAAGYQLRDSWQVDDLDCLIPFHPERFLRSFSGFVFELLPTGQST